MDNFNLIPGVSQHVWHPVRNFQPPRYTQLTTKIWVCNIGEIFECVQVLILSPPQRHRKSFLSLVPPHEEGARDEDVNHHQTVQPEVNVQ